MNDLYGPGSSLYPYNPKRWCGIRYYWMKSRENLRLPVIRWRGVKIARAVFEVFGFKRCVHCMRWVRSAVSEGDGYYLCHSCATLQEIERLCRRIEWVAGTINEQLRLVSNMLGFR